MVLVKKSNFCFKGVVCGGKMFFPGIFHRC